MVFTERTGVPAEHNPLGSFDYPGEMEKKFIYGDNIDVIYVNPDIAARFLEAGWLINLSDKNAYSEAREDLYENIRQGIERDGKLLGLVYFATTRVLPLVNLRAYSQIGLNESDFPKNWDALYDQIIAVANKGHREFYLPHWFGDWYGITYAFIAEVLNRGGHVVGPDNFTVVMETTSGPAYETLIDWRRANKSGAISQTVFDMSDADFTQAFRSGKYAISPQTAYDLFNTNDKSKVNDIGVVSLFPSDPESTWGVLDISLYSLVNNEYAGIEHQENVEKFFQWYGYKTEEGEYYIAKNWLEKEGLFSGYRGFMESSEARDIMESKLPRLNDVQVLLDIFQKTPYANGLWKVIWSEDFNVYLKGELQSYLKNDSVTPEALISRLNQKILDLRSSYGY